jgi:hypothetical protein
MRNSNDLETLLSLPVDDVVRESTYRNSTRGPSDAGPTNYAADLRILLDHAKGLLNLAPEFIAKAGSLTFVPGDLGTKLGLRLI